MVRSALLDRLRKQGASAYPDQPGGYGYGIYGERYEPESRKDFVQAYRDRVWVQRCCNLIAQSFTQVKVQAFKDEAQKRPIDDDNHPLLSLIRRPNRRDPAQQFFQLAGLWSQIIGEWYFEAVPGRGGVIAELHPLRGHLVNVEPGERGAPSGYTYDPNETGDPKIEYEPVDPESGKVAERQVIAGRFYNPLDDWYGMPPLRGAKDDIISEYYAVRYDHRFFRNSARPDIIIGFDELTQEERKKNREAWDEFKGVDRSHRAAVMSGIKDVYELGKTQRDVEYLEGRRLAREGECAAFGVPSILVGDLTRGTYSNFKEAEPIFWKGTMLSLLWFMAEWANFQLVPFFPDVDHLAFDVSEIQALQESENDKADRHVKLVAGGVESPNEARDDLGKDERPEDEADMLYVPMSLVPLTPPEEDPTPDPLTPAGEPSPPPPPAEGNGNGGGDAGLTEEQLRQMLEAAQAAAGG